MMKRCFTLGLSLCLLGLLSGCCCGPRPGRGCCAPSPCGQPFGAFQPFNGCSSCGTAGFGAAPSYGTPYGAVPSTYLPQTYGAATLPMDGTTVPSATAFNAAPMTATTYGQPVYGQINQTGFDQPAMEQAAPFAESGSPVTTALMKPESLPTY